MAHAHDAKSDPHFDNMAKDLSDLLRARGRSNVKVLGLQAQPQVAHATADPKGLMTGLPQTAHDIGRHVSSGQVGKLDAGVINHGGRIARTGARRNRACGGQGQERPGQSADQFLLSS